MQLPNRSGSRISAVLHALALFFICGKASATWSIIIIDTRTGEIAVGSATCIAGADLRALTAVIVVGKGGACAQSAVDTTGNNRRRIFDGFRQGLSPSQILAALAASDGSHQTRQYGIVDTQGRSLGFTGTQASSWKGHVTGRIGTLVYAIQGNLLAGSPVVTAAEAAVRSTPGDLPTKLMAGMEAARARGGDARCNPAKSSDIAFAIVARAGDRNGVCNSNVGCASGRYYLNLNVRGASSSPDPVFTLWNQFHTWRKSIFGVPDHHTSTVSLQSATLPADAQTKTTATVALRDYTAGGVLQSASTTLTVTTDPTSTAPAQIGAVRRNSDGTYSFDVTSGATTGIARLRIVANHAGGTTRLAPLTEIPITDAKLWVSQPTVSTASGANLEFVINQGSAHANQPYVLLASLSGTTPGFSFGGVNIPLNPDALFNFIVANHQSLPGFLGSLDASGRRAIGLSVPAGAFAVPVGSQMHFATLRLNPLGGVSAPHLVEFVR